MNRTVTLALATLLFAGCAQHKTTHLPDGRQGHSISCSGGALNWNLCYEKAGEVCGARGYEVIAKEGDQSSSVSGNQYGVYGGTNVTRTLLISCK